MVPRSSTWQIWATPDRIGFPLHFVNVETGQDQALVRIGDGRARLGGNPGLHPVAVRQDRRIWMAVGFERYDSRSSTARPAAKARGAKVAGSARVEERGSDARFDHSDSRHLIRDSPLSWVDGTVVPSQAKNADRAVPVDFT